MLPGSYEEEVLGLPVGTIIDAGKPGRPSLGPITSYAQNKKYFTVSDAWEDLQGAPKDELKAYAWNLRVRDIPARYVPGGKPPAAAETGEWGAVHAEKWLSANESSLGFLDRYVEARREYEKKKKPKKYLEYLAAARLAYSPKGTQAQRDDLADDWAKKFSWAERYLLTEKEKLFKSDPRAATEKGKMTGIPTEKGKQVGKWAQIDLERRAKDAAKRTGAAARQVAKQAEEEAAEAARMDAIRKRMAQRRGLPRGEEG